MQKRWTELGKAEKLLLEEDVALVPLYQSAKSYVMKPNVKGIVKHNISPNIALNGRILKRNKREEHFQVAVSHLGMLFMCTNYGWVNICIIENLKENFMKRNTYIDFLAYYGIGVLILVVLR